MRIQDWTFKSLEDQSEKIKKNKQTGKRRENFSYGKLIKNT